MAEPGKNDRGRMNDILDVNDDAGINSMEEVKIIEGDYILTIDDEEIVIPFTYSFISKEE